MDTIGNFGIAQVEDDMNTFEHHPQDSRVKPTEVAPTCGVFGNSIEEKDCLVQQEPYVKTCRAKGADGLGERWESKQVSPTLNVFDTGDKRSVVNVGEKGIVASFVGGQGSKAGGIGYKENVSSTIKAAPSGGNQVPDIVIGQNSFVDTGHGDYWKKDDAAGTIRSEGESRPSRPSNVICVHGSQDPISNTEHANAVNRNNGLENCVAIPINSMVIGKDIKEGDRQTTGIGKEGDPCPTLQTEHHHAVASHLSVRRLLPIECERLMGMPDNWTRIPWRGKPADECLDAPRYKACGNSMGVNCMRWIGLGIEAVENGIRQQQQSKRSKK